MKAKMIWQILRKQSCTCFKKGDQSQIINYSPIAITSVLSKIMEMVINQHVLRHLETNKIINDRQYGFRRYRSTDDILTYVTHTWNKTIETGKESSPGYFKGFCPSLKQKSYC